MDEGDEGDGRDGLLGWDAGDFWESRSNPLISVRLSTALRRDVGYMWADWAGFGGDFDGFGRWLGGFGGAAFGGGVLGCRHWGWATGWIRAVG